MFHFYGFEDDSITKRRPMCSLDGIFDDRIDYTICIYSAMLEYLQLISIIFGSIKSI